MTYQEELSVISRLIPKLKLFNDIRKNLLKIKYLNVDIVVRFIASQSKAQILHKQVSLLSQKPKKFIKPSMMFPL